MTPDQLVSGLDLLTWRLELERVRLRPGRHMPGGLADDPVICDQRLKTLAIEAGDAGYDLMPAKSARRRAQRRAVRRSVRWR